ATAPAGRRADVLLPRTVPLTFPAFVESNLSLPCYSRMIMPLCHRLPIVVATAAMSASFAAAAAAPAVAPVTAPAEVPAPIDANAAVAGAEQALQRGDCGTASRLYRQASQALEQPELAAHASAVALGCGQYTTAHAIAEAWLKFSPGDSS